MTLFVMRYHTPDAGKCPYCLCVNRIAGNWPAPPGLPYITSQFASKNLPLLKGLYAVNISSYEDLLNAANAQAEPQRLLFVFAGAELPDDCTAGQKKRFQARQGGALSPVMCVDKLAGERGSFAGLVEESRQTGAGWDVVFVACMPVQSGTASDDETGRAFKVMIRSIQDGKIGNFLAFNPDGELLQLVAS